MSAISRISPGGLSGATAMAISGLQAGVAQLTASASNVANAQTSGSLSGSSSSFGPATLTGQASAAAGFETYRPVQAISSTAPDGGVESQFQPVQPATTPAYQPDSPAADAQGMVAMPNVDLSQQMVGQMGALAYFKANLATLKVADEMQQSLLDIA